VITTMALIKCGECGREVSSNAEACPHCGNPIGAAERTAGTYCPHCRVHVTPAVTSVGGGTCSFGKRETWKCPQCFRVLHRSGCFVATVAYGDEDLIEVRFLRAFRDTVLSKTITGRIAIHGYYLVGGITARVVEIIPFAKPVCRRILDLVIIYIERQTPLRRNHFRPLGKHLP
jgi:hypothetical protein